MNHKLNIFVCLAIVAVHTVYAQRIVTIQLDGTQYYVSKMNPYASELNYFLAYQYCRSIGLQLVSFETREKADSIAEYLKNAGYSQHDFWTSGNHLGSNMLLWMSTGLPFNATFNYMRKQEGDEPSVPNGPLPMGRRKRGNGIGNTGCIALKAHALDWDTEDCSKLKDFICEQTRCYFYNYGSIPVSSAQGHHKQLRDHSSTVSTKTAATHVPHYLTRSTSPSYGLTSAPALETTNYAEKATESDAPAQSYNEYSDSLTSTQEEPKPNSNNDSNSEEENNEIDLNHTTEFSASEISETTVKYEKTVFDDDEQKYALLSSSNRLRAVEIHGEKNTSISARNMPGPQEQVSYPWPWAKNIQLEKPVNKKKIE